MKNLYLSKGNIALIEFQFAIKKKIVSIFSLFFSKNKLFISMGKIKFLANYFYVAQLDIAKIFKIF